MSEAFGRGVSGDNVQYLVDEKLRPLGVLAQEDGSSPPLRKVDPLLALKFRAAVVPAWLVGGITTIFRPLFFPPVVVAVLGALVALDVWLFAYHGVAQSLRQTLYDPALLFLVLGLVVLSAAFHECGHATACRYGGAKPGVMGVGIYLVWPAFYTDVTDAYRLNRTGRLRTDLGGIYFNVVFILATAGAYLLTGFEPLLLLIPIQHLEIVHQLLPFIRLDGYYIVSDLTGVPDMFSRIKPTLRSMIPGRKTDDRVAELKPWVRGAVTVYVLTVIPVLAFMFGFMLFNAPRIFATAWDSFFVQWDKVSTAADDGRFFSVAAGGLQMAILALPSAGLVASFGRIAKRASVAAWSRTAGHPVARAGLVAAGTALTALAAFVWWPNGEYKPIQPGERGTIQGAIAQLAEVPSGRPGLPPERERELGGAPTRRSQDGAPAAPGGPEDEAPTQTTRTEPSGTTTERTETAPQPGGTPTQPTDTVTGPTATERTPTTTTTTSTTPTTSATTSEETPTTTTP